MTAHETIVIAPQVVEGHLDIIRRWKSLAPRSTAELGSILHQVARIRENLLNSFPSDATERLKRHEGPDLLHVRLILPLGSAMSQLPWEVIQAQDDLSPRRNICLTLVEGDICQGTLRHEKPTIVHHAATPFDQPPIETEHLAKIWLETGTPAVNITPGGTMADLKSAMRRLRPDVVVLSCHGDGDRVLLEGESGGAEWISIANFASLINHAHTYFLGICYSCSSPRSLPSLAKRLCESRQNCFVAGLTGRVGAQSVTLAERTFVLSLLGVGDPLSAVQAARLAVSEHSNVPLDWAAIRVLVQGFLPAIPASEVRYATVESRSVEDLRLHSAVRMAIAETRHVLQGSLRYAGLQIPFTSIRTGLIRALGAACVRGGVREVRNVMVLSLPRCAPDELQRKLKEEVDIVCKGAPLPPRRMQNRSPTPVKQIAARLSSCARNTVVVIAGCETWIDCSVRLKWSHHCIGEFLAALRRSLPKTSLLWLVSSTSVPGVRTVPVPLPISETAFVNNPPPLPAQAAKLVPFWPHPVRATVFRVLSPSIERLARVGVIVKALGICRGWLLNMGLAAVWVPGLNEKLGELFRLAAEDVNRQRKHTADFGFPLVELFFLVWARMWTQAFDLLKVLSADLRLQDKMALRLTLVRHFCDAPWPSEKLSYVLLELADAEYSARDLIAARSTIARCRAVQGGLSIRQVAILHRLQSHVEQEAGDFSAAIYCLWKWRKSASGR